MIDKKFNFKLNHQQKSLFLLYHSQQQKSSQQMAFQQSWNSVVPQAEPYLRSQFQCRRSYHKIRLHFPHKRHNYSPKISKLCSLRSCKNTKKYHFDYRLVLSTAFFPDPSGSIPGILRFYQAKCQKQKDERLHDAQMKLTTQFLVHSLFFRAWR